MCIVRAHEVQEDGYKRHFDPSLMERRMKEILGHKQRVKEQEKEDKKRILLGIESLSAMANQDGEVNWGDSGTPGRDRLKGDEQHTPLSEVTMGSDSALSEPSQFATYTEEFPPVITIFSAPNYCDRYQNKAAILRIDLALDEFRVIQYSCVEHPVPEVAESQMDNHFLAIISTCPYMPTSLSNFVRLAVELGPESNWVMDARLEVIEEKEIEREIESKENSPDSRLNAGADDLRHIEEYDEDSSSMESEILSTPVRTSTFDDICAEPSSRNSVRLESFATDDEVLSNLTEDMPDDILEPKSSSDTQHKDDFTSPKFQSTFISPSSRKISSIPAPKVRKVSVSIPLVRHNELLMGMGMGLMGGGETSPVVSARQLVSPSPHSPRDTGVTTRVWSLIPSNTRCFNYSFIRSFIFYSFILPSTHSFIHLFITHYFIHSNIHSRIHSYIYSFIEF